MPELITEILMKTPSEFLNSACKKKVLVWDVPTRTFHWLFALSFVGAYLTAESERWRLLHVTLGYTMAGLVVFRLVWGLMGTRYARFTNFVRGPRAVGSYLESLIHNQPEHYMGHNPAGALAIVAMLGLASSVAVTGLGAYNDISGEWLAILHAWLADMMLLLVGIHIAGVVVASWLHREPLVVAMLTGRKPGQANDGIASNWWSVGGLILVYVLTFWCWQWQASP